MPESDDFKIKTHSTGENARSGRWTKWTEVEGRRYLLNTQKLGDNSIVRAKDVETGEVLTDQSLDLHDNLAVQKKLVGACMRRRGHHDRAR